MRASWIACEIDFKMSLVRFEIQRELSAVYEELDYLRQELRLLKRHLHRLHGVNTSLPPIAKPKNVNASSNIVGALRKEIELLNTTNELQYEQFTSTDAYANRELKCIMGNLLRAHLPTAYGKQTWYHSLRSGNSAACDKIIEQASLLPEYHILTQTSNYWAIRLIADAKMRSAQRDRGQAVVDNEINVHPRISQPPSNHNTANPFKVATPVESERQHLESDQNIRDVVLGHANSVRPATQTETESQRDGSRTVTDVVHPSAAIQERSSFHSRLENACAIVPSSTTDAVNVRNRSRQENSLTLRGIERQRQQPNARRHRKSQIFRPGLRRT